MANFRWRWLVTGCGGALLLGAGLSCTVESGFLKHSGAATHLWIIAGTVSLAMVVAGVVLLIRAGTMQKKDKSN